MGMRIVGHDAQYGAVHLDDSGHTWVVANGSWAAYNKQIAMPGSAAHEPPPPPQGSSAQMIVPQHADLAAMAKWARSESDEHLPPTYRRGFYPTAPMYYRGAGKITRDYVLRLQPGDPDYVVGAAVPRTIPFSVPVILIARNGGAVSTGVGNAFPVGINSRNCFLVEFRLGSNNVAIDTAPTLAENVLGTGERPGEIGGDGFPINAGDVLIANITPLLPNLNISISMIMLEQLGRQNFVPPG
jgi:hypothetical protein